MSVQGTGAVARPPSRQKGLHNCTGNRSSSKAAVEAKRVCITVQGTGAVARPPSRQKGPVLHTGGVEGQSLLEKKPGSITFAEYKVQNETGIHTREVRDYRSPPRSRDYVRGVGQGLQQGPRPRRYLDYEKEDISLCGAEHSFRLPG